MSEEKMTVEKAAEILKSGYHCSQCVIGHAAPGMGVDKDQALRLTAGLGGGCFHGEICGAVSAAVIALGAAYGFDQPHAKEQNAILVAKVTEFERRYAEKFGSLRCKELLGGYDISNPEDMKVIREKGLMKNCPAYCTYACDLLDDMLKDSKK